MELSLISPQITQQLIDLAHMETLRECLELRLFFSGVDLQSKNEIEKNEIEILRKETNIKIIQLQSSSIKRKENIKIDIGFHLQELRINNE